MESFSFTGPRNMNEDSIYPDALRDHDHSINHSLFLVCDGVGGQAKGEIASDFICTQLPLYYKSKKIQNSNKTIAKQAIQFLESKFDSYISSSPESYGMGSTLAFLHAHSKGVTLAYVGDTRIYHLRDGKIIFNTEDHSYVYAKYKTGLLTREQMEYQTDRNVILQALQGSVIQKVKPTIFTITNLQIDDVFFLCTDGTWESFSVEEFENVIRRNWSSLTEMKNEIIEKCNVRSYDNFSGIFIKLNEDYINNLKINEEENEKINKDNKESYQELLSLYHSALGQK